jgi:hypothetical protein
MIYGGFASFGYALVGMRLSMSVLEVLALVFKRSRQHDPLAGPPLVLLDLNSPRW